MVMVYLRNGQRSQYEQNYQMAVSAAVGANVTVALASSNTNKIRVPSSVVIPSLLEFVLTLRLANSAVIASSSWVCTMEGEATIYKPNARF
jgi:hypothetical protein